MERNCRLNPIADEWPATQEHAAYTEARAAINKRIEAFHRQAEDLDAETRELAEMPLADFNDAAIARAQRLGERRTKLLREELTLRHDYRDLLEKRTKARNATVDKQREMRDREAEIVIDGLKKMGFDFEWRGSCPPLMSPSVALRHPFVREHDDNLRAWGTVSDSQTMRDNAADIITIERELQAERRKMMRA